MQTANQSIDQRNARDIGMTLAPATKALLSALQNQVLV